MFDDDLLRGRYRTYVAQRQELAERQRVRLEREDRGLLAALADLAAHFDRAVGALDDDLPGRFAALHTDGRIELITTTATHGFAPLLADMPGAWGVTGARRCRRLRASVWSPAARFLAAGVWVPARRRTRVGGPRSALLLR